jgi:hypothetical protein
VILAAFAFVRAPELRGEARDRVAAAVVFAVALALRLGLGIWAPLHINGQGPLWIGAAAVRPAMLVGYGPGYPEVFAAVTALGGDAPDLAMFAANATAAAFVPALAFALGRIAGLERERALLAGLVLAIDPVAVRFSASESYFVPIVVLTLAATTAIAAAVHVSVRSRSGAAASMVAAALLAMQAARIHPVAWIPVAMCPLAALLPRVSATRRLAGLATAVVLVAIAHGITSAGWLDAVSADASRYAQGTSHRVARPIVVIAIGVAAAIARVKEWPLVFVAALSLALDAILRPIYGQSDAWQACFDRLFLAVPALALAGILPRAAFHGSPRLALAGGVLVVAVAIGWPLRMRTTEQVEYRWLRDELARVDPECRVASVTRAGQRVHYVPWYRMNANAGGPARWIAVASPAVLADATRGGRCVVWLHASICESTDGRALCESIEAAVPLDEIASVEIPAVPSARPYPYDVDVVRVSLHRASPEVPPRRR